MLASTVQFSTYDQTPPTRPRQTRHTHRRHGGTRNREALTREETTTRINRTPALSGPNSVPTDRLSPVTTFHAPKGRTSSGRRCRPNWSAFHPRAPPQTRAARQK
jgi:hypothetical protein